MTQENIWEEVSLEEDDKKKSQVANTQLQSQDGLQNSSQSDLGGQSTSSEVSYRKELKEGKVGKFPDDYNYYKKDKFGEKSVSKNTYDFGNKSQVNKEPKSIESLPVVELPQIDNDIQDAIVPEIKPNIPQYDETPRGKINKGLDLTNKQVADIETLKGQTEETLLQQEEEKEAYEDALKMYSDNPPMLQVTQEAYDKHLALMDETKATFDELNGEYEKSLNRKDILEAGVRNINAISDDKQDDVADFMKDVWNKSVPNLIQGIGQTINLVGDVTVKIGGTEENIWNNVGDYLVNSGEDMKGDVDLSYKNADVFNEVTPTSVANFTSSLIGGIVTNLALPENTAIQVTANILSAVQSAYESAKEVGYSEPEARRFAFTVAPIVGITEQLGENVTLKPIRKKLLEAAAKELKGKSIDKSTTNIALGKIFKSAPREFFEDVAKKSSVEGGSEVLGEVGTIATETQYDKFKTDLSSPDGALKAGERVVKSFVGGAAGGTLLAPLGFQKSKEKQRLQQDIINSKGDLSQLDDYFKAIDAYEQEVDPTKAEEMRTKLTKMVERETRIPSLITNPEAREQSSELIEVVDKLREEKEKSDPSYHKIMDESIKGIEADLQEILLTNKPIDKSYDLKVEETTKSTTAEIPKAGSVGVGGDVKVNPKEDISDRTKWKISNIVVDENGGLNKHFVNDALNDAPNVINPTAENFKKGINFLDALNERIGDSDLGNTINFLKDQVHIVELMQQGRKGAVDKYIADRKKVYTDISNTLKKEGFEAAIEGREKIVERLDETQRQLNLLGLQWDAERVVQKQYQETIKEIRKRFVDENQKPKRLLQLPSSEQVGADLGEETPQVSKKEELEKNLENAKQQFLKSSRSSLSSGGMQSVEYFAKYIKAWVELNGYRVKELVGDLRKYFGDSEYIKQFKTDEDLENHIIDVRQEKIEKESKKNYPTLKRAQDWAFAEGRTVGAIEQAKQDNKGFQKEKNLASKEAQRLIDNAYDFGFAEGGVSGKLEQAKVEGKEKENLLKDFQKEKSNLSKEEQIRVDNAYDFGVADGRTKGDWLVNEANLLDDYINNNKDFRAKINKSSSAKSVLFNKLNSLLKSAQSKDSTRQKKLDDLKDYLDKLEEDGDYQNKLDQLKKDVKGAKKKKHIVLEQNRVKEFLSINPNKLDKDLFEKYIEAVKNLNNKEGVPDYKEMDKIFHLVTSGTKEEVEINSMEEHSKLDKYLTDFISLPITTPEEYKAAIRKLSQIENQASLLKDNSEDLGNKTESEQLSKLINSIGQFKKKWSDEHQEFTKDLKESLTQEIKSHTPDTSEMSDAEKVMVEEYEDMINSKDLNKLNVGDLDALSEIAERMSQGYVPIYQLGKVLDNFNAVKNVDELGEQLKDVKKKILSKEFTNDKFIEKYKGRELSFFEDFLGIKEGALTTKLINPLIRGLSKSKINLGHNIQKFYDKLGVKWYNRRGVKKEDSFKVGVLMHTLMESVNDDRDWLGTILSNSNEIKKIKKSDQKILQNIYNELLKKYPNKDGGLDIKKLADDIENNPSRVMNEDQLRLNKAAREAFDSMKDKQSFINSYSGLPFNERQHYVPTMRMMGAGDVKDAATSDRKKRTRIKSPSGMAKVSDEITAIDFDIENLVLNHLLSVEKDYNVTQAKGKANKLLQELFDRGVDESLVNNLREVTKSVIEFEYSTGENGVLNKIWKKIVPSSIAIALLTPVRLAAETTSVISGLATGRIGTNVVSKSFIKSLIPHSKLSKERRVYNKLIEQTSSSIFVKESNRHVDSEQTGIRGKGNLELVFNTLNSITDTLITPAIWMPEFTNQFKEITGNDFNLDEYENNPYYRKVNKDAIFDAASMADVKTKQITGGGIKGEGRQAIKASPFKPSREDFFGGVYLDPNTIEGKAMGLLTNFMNRESHVALDMGLAQVVTGGPQGRLTALGRFTGVATSWFVFEFTRQYLNALKNSEIGDDEEKEKAEEKLEAMKNPEYFTQLIKEQSISLAQSRYNNAGKLIGLSLFSAQYQRIKKDESLSDYEKKEALESLEKTAKDLYGYRGNIKSWNEAPDVLLESLLPPISMLLKSAKGLLMSSGKSMSAAEFSEWVTKMPERIANGEQISEDEVEAYRVFNFVTNTLNLATIITIGQPTIPKIDDLFLKLRGQSKPNLEKKEQKNDSNDPFSVTKKNKSVNKSDPFNIKEKKDKKNKSDPFKIH